MITGFEITQDEWNQTPQPVRIAAASLQHQLYILNARLNVYQKQNTDLQTKVESVDKVIDLRPDCCSACGSLLLGEECRPARRQTIELVGGRAFFTGYRNHCLCSLACRKLTRAEWSEDAAAETFGASVSAMIAYLTGRLNLSRRDAVEAMRESFNLKIGLGSISALQHRVSERLAEPVAHALEFVQQQALQCVDETGWQENNRLNWLWVNCTERVTVFQIQTGRGQTNAQTIIDEEETGVITTDRYPRLWFSARMATTDLLGALKTRFHGDDRARRCRK